MTPSNQKSKVCNILLIEDNMSQAYITKEQLSKRHPQINFHYAPSIQMAKALIYLHQVDLLLVDLHLPDSDHDETIPHLRSIVKGVPIIVLSDSESWAKEKLRELNVLKFFRKSDVTYDDLSDEIESIMRVEKLKFPVPSSVIDAFPSMKVQLLGAEKVGFLKRKVIDAFDYYVGKSFMLKDGPMYQFLKPNKEKTSFTEKDIFDHIHAVISKHYEMDVIKVHADFPEQEMLGSYEHIQFMLTRTLEFVINSHGGKGLLHFTVIPRDIPQKMVQVSVDYIGVIKLTQHFHNPLNHFTLDRLESTKRHEYDTALFIKRLNALQSFIQAHEGELTYQKEDDKLQIKLCFPYT